MFGQYDGFAKSVTEHAKLSNNIRDLYGICKVDHHLSPHGNDGSALPLTVIGAVYCVLILVEIYGVQW